MMEFAFKGDYRAYFRYLYEIGEHDEKDNMGNPIFKITHEMKMIFPNLYGKSYTLHLN